MEIRKTPSQWITFIIIVVILSIAYGFYSYLEQKTEVSVTKIPPVEVKKAIVKSVDWPTIIKTTGEVNGLDGVTLKAEYEGRVTSIETPGSNIVEQDQLLITINPSGLASKLKSDIETYNLAKTHLDELTPLAKSGAIPQWQFQQGKKNYLVAKALMERTKKELALSSLRAPFKGKIGIYQVRIGDYVTKGQAIVNIQNFNSKRVDFTIPARYAQYLRKNLKVNLKTNFSDKIIKAKVIQIDSTIDSQSQTIAVRAVFDSDKITPGLFTRVDLILSNQRQEILVIPQTSIVYTPEGTFVYIIQKNKVKEVPVSIGEIRQGFVQIKSGLKVNQSVVALGAQKLHNGALIKFKD